MDDLPKGWTVDARGKYTIEQGETEPITLALGQNGYIIQGDGMVLVERRHALALSDKLAAWGAAQSDESNEDQLNG